MHEYSDEFYDLVDQYVASGRYGGRPEAADAVRRARPDLCPNQRSKNTMTTISSGSSSAGGNAERELEQRAREISARERITFAAAYVKALNSDLSLYLRYLQQQEAKLGTGARRG